MSVGVERCSCWYLRQRYFGNRSVISALLLLSITHLLCVVVGTTPRLAEGELTVALSRASQSDRMKSFLGQPEEESPLFATDDFKIWCFKVTQPDGWRPAGLCPTHELACCSVLQQ